MSNANFKPIWTNGTAPQKPDPLTGVARGAALLVFLAIIVLVCSGLAALAGLLLRLAF